MQPIFFLNGRFIPQQKAQISALDRGFLYGDGVFETMRTYQNKIFRLDAHIRRMYSGLKVLTITPPYTIFKLKKIIHELIKRNNISNAYIRVNITAGAQNFSVQEKSLRPTVLIIIQKYKPYAEKFYKRGIYTIIAKGKQNENSVLCNVKSLNYLNNLLAIKQAYENKAQEAILLNSRGMVCEGATSNIFIVQGGKIITPALNAGCLAGITRQAIIDIAQRHNIQLREKNITLKDLFKASEVFITNSLKEVIAVVKIDKRLINNGKPGPITGCFAQAYKKLVCEELSLR